MMRFATVKLKQNLLLWLISLLLMAPAAWPYFTHYFVNRDNLIPTGFIHPDMPSYMANAREHFDAGHFRLTYSNPASFSYESPPIYFQPLILVLAIVSRLTSLSPGIVFMLVGFVTALCCARAALALYGEVMGLRSWPQKLGLVAFCWGGGVLALAGIAYKFLVHDPGIGVFRFDPADGWWFLNFGRNLIFPTEAFYHALFFMCILCALKHWYKAALAFAFLVSLSHPFTGIELLAILCTWTIIEIYFMENREIPRLFAVGCCVLMALHVAYYLVFLNLFPEHRSLSSEWSLPWLLQAESFMPAYALVGSLTVIRLRRFGLASEVLRLPSNRLFLIWFLVAFALANHEFAIRPIQPLHFTRGYCWIALFFLGAPLLVKIFEYLISRKLKVVGLLALVAILGLFLSDNILWFGSFLKRQDQGIRLTRDEAQLIKWFNSSENRGYIVVSREPELGYMATVYTPLRSWVSHWETPQRITRQAEVDAFFGEGKFLDRWRTLPLLLVFSKAEQTAGTDAAWQTGKPVFQNASYAVFRHDGTIVPEEAHQTINTLDKHWPSMFNRVVVARLRVEHMDLSKLLRLHTIKANLP